MMPGSIRHSPFRSIAATGAGVGRAALWFALAVLLLLFGGALSPARAGAVSPQEPPAVPLSSQTSRESLVGRIGYFVDAGAVLDIDAVRSPEGQARFRVPAEAVSAGADRQPRWFKIRLREHESGAREWLLTVASLPLESLRCFGPYPEPESGGAALPVAAASADCGLGGRTGPQRGSIAIAVPGPGQHVVYLRAQSVLPQAYAMALWPVGAFYEAQRDAWLLDGICYGLLLGIIGYTFLMWRTFRDPVYLYFLAALPAVLALLAVFHGHLPRALLAQPSELRDRLLLALPALLVLLALQFGRRYLDLARHVPRIGQVVRALAALSAAAAVGALAGAWAGSSLAIALAALLGLLLLPFGLRPSKKHGFRINAWYLIASGACFVSMLALLGALWGWLPHALIDNRYLQLVAVLELAVFALVYGQRLPRIWGQQAALRDRATALAHLAETDPLTGIANRSGLMRRAPALLAPGRQCALLMLDLDHFKPVNDRFGHAIGDAVLVQVARRLEALARPHDLLVRLGGDEFALLLADPPQRDEAAALAQRVIEAVARPLDACERLHWIGASVGIARFPHDAEDLSSLLHCADLALYRAKQAGRGAFTFFEDLPPETARRMA